MRFKPRYRIWQVLLGIVFLAALAAFFYFLSGGFDKPLHETEQDPNANPESSLRGFHDFIYFIVLVYFSLNYYYQYIAANRKLLSFLGLTAAIAGAALAYKTFLFYAIPLALHHQYNSPFGVYQAMIPELLPLLLLCYMFAYGTYLWESKKQRRILEAQKLQLETQIAQANFNFLKAQINPHFLHNTLNYLYAKSLPYSEELSEGILTLSDIMRYALSQGHQQEGKAPLTDEVEHVRNVIKISQLRYSNQLHVHFAVRGKLEGATIIPFVLITLVENAFMHGDLKDPDFPIDIRLEVTGGRLYFYCRNKKRSGPKQLSTGIGLDNIRKRLDLAYGDQYRFTIKDEPDFYTTELNIDKL